MLIHVSLIPHSDLKTHTLNANDNTSGMKALTNCMTLNHLWGNYHKFMYQMQNTKKADDGKELSNTEMAETMNKHFSTIGSKLSEKFNAN